MTNLTQVPMHTSFLDLVDLSVHHSGDSIELDCSLTITITNRHGDSIEMQAYTVSLANRDLLFYTDKGTATYLVDSINSRHIAVLYDWTLDDDNT